MRFVQQAAGLVALATLCFPAHAEVDFSSEVQPIFAQHCYECHGPEERKGGLRLTNRRDAFSSGDFGVPVITESSARASLLFDLISSDQSDERMPRDRDPLSPEQIELIGRWIDEGAQWPEDERATAHWSYTPPKPAPPPATSDETWARTPIDQFILARLERDGWQPAEEAPAAALLRRVHFDLTGLPPSPRQLEAFLANPTDSAYEAIVDALLSSPQFGEHWAVQWLDAARYADSTGFMSEVALTNWPYRDWVIGAINEDLPFDDFTIKQIAGDLLPNASTDDRVATGFHRAAPLNLEAGVREEESRITQVIDRVNTTASVWLGMTMACAQCHDHKYDSLSQEEYFGFLAFFDHTAKEAVSSDGMGGVNLVPGGPTIELPHREVTRERAAETAEGLLEVIEQGLPETFPDAPAIRDEERKAISSAIARMDYEGTLAAAGSILLNRLSAREGPSWWRPWSRWWDSWLEDVRAQIGAGEPKWRNTQVLSLTTTDGGDFEILDDGSVLLRGHTPDWVTYTLDVAAPTSPVTGIRIQAMGHPSLPGGGPGRRNPAQPDFVLSEVSVEEVAGTQRTPVAMHSALASAHWSGGSPATAIDDDSRTGWAYVVGAHPGDQWIIIVPVEPIELAENEVLRLHLVQVGGAGRTLGRFRVQTSAAPASIVTMPPALQRAVVDKDWKDLEPIEEAVLLTLARRDILAEYTPAFDVSRQVFDRLPPKPRAHVMVEEDERRTTRLFERGDPHVPGREVEAATPAVLHPMAAEQTRDRLALARWLVADDNPVTARVTANRWWAQLFGRGLVSTLSDFGVRGERPSHPELLDWLAWQLVESDWSRKKLLRQMVLSSVYRQSVVSTDPATHQSDPDNRRLSRGSRLRLPAEAIRDNALQVAGILSPVMGGPAVSPPQPPGAWRANGHQPVEYVPSKGEDNYRRGVYTIWRRTAAYPSFKNFDAGDRTKCSLDRSHSNTPLQALTLLNDEVYSEAALSFAQRLLNEQPDVRPEERLRYAFRLAVSRDPSEEELELMTDLLDERRKRIIENPAEVRALLTHSPRFQMDDGVDPDELAAWFTVGRVLLNLDETIHRG